jgi:hypothetical protein
MALTAVRLDSGEFNLGDFHKKHAIATWNLGLSQHLIKDREKQRGPVSRCPVEENGEN